MSETPVVRIALLGGLTVTVGPLVVADAAWPTRRAAELVALLALADGHRLVRDARGPAPGRRSLRRPGEERSRNTRLTPSGP